MIISECLSNVPFASERVSYFEGGTPIVDVWIKTFVIAKIQFIFEVFHCDTGILRHSR
jgi:hypothetical protein